MPLTNCIDNIIVSVGSSLASLRIYGGIFFLYVIMMGYPCSYCSGSNHHGDGFKDPKQLTTLRLPIIFFVTHCNWISFLRFDFYECRPESAGRSHRGENAFGPTQVQPFLQKTLPACQDEKPRSPIAASSSRKTVNFLRTHNDALSFVDGRQQRKISTSLTRFE